MKPNFTRASEIETDWRTRWSDIIEATLKPEYVIVVLPSITNHCRTKIHNHWAFCLIVKPRWSWMSNEISHFTFFFLPIRNHQSGVSTFLLRSVLRVVYLEQSCDIFPITVCLPKRQLTYRSSFPFLVALSLYFSSL